MSRRSTIIVISLVLCGVIALSVPASADRNSQTTKATAPTVNVTVVKTTTSTSVIKSEFVRTGWRDGLRFWLRNWFGWPYIHIVGPKPPVPGEPFKSGPGGHGKWDDVARDHGGSDDV